MESVLSTEGHAKVTENRRGSRGESHRKAIEKNYTICSTHTDNELNRLQRTLRYESAKMTVPLPVDQVESIWLIDLDTRRFRCNADRADISAHSVCPPSRSCPGTRVCQFEL